MTHKVTSCELNETMIYSRLIAVYVARQDDSLTLTYQT